MVNRFFSDTQNPCSFQFQLNFITIAIENEVFLKKFQFSYDYLLGTIQAEGYMNNSNISKFITFFPTVCFFLVDPVYIIYFYE